MISDASRAERASSSRVNMKGGAHHQDEEKANVLEVHGPEVADVRRKRWQQATELEKTTCSQTCTCIWQKQALQNVLCVLYRNLLLKTCVAWYRWLLMCCYLRVLRTTDNRTRMAGTRLLRDAYVCGAYQERRQQKKTPAET